MKMFSFCGKGRYQNEKEIPFYSETSNVIKTEKCSPATIFNATIAIYFLPLNNVLVSKFRI